MRPAILLVLAAALPVQDPASEVTKLVEEIRAGLPQGEGAAADRARRESLLAGRERMAKLAKAHEGTEPGLTARLHCGTLALAADDKALAASDLEPVLEAVASADSGERLAIRLDALEWLAQASPARARPYLEAAEKLSGAPGKAARRIRRRIDAAEKSRVGLPPIPFRAKSIRGEALSPETFAGKVLVIEFWSSANADCMRELAELKPLYRDLHASGLEIVGVNLDRGAIRSVPGGREPSGRGPEGVARFAADFEMPWPQVHDGDGWNGDLPELFAVASLPFTVVVDRRGVVRALGAPATELAARVRELVAEK